MFLRWYARTAGEKVLLICRFIVSAVMIVCTVLQLMEKWDRGLHVAVPLMGVNLVLIAIDEWHESRGAAIFSLCAAVFIFACAAAVWFLP